MAEAIAIITARGGSKRIPRKNIRGFCGKPIMQYSIEAALESYLFDEVMVSTDDAEIAEIAKKCGANVPFMRSEEASNDYATTSDVILEVINEYEKLGKTFDNACCIYPTAPFVTAQQLKKADETLKKEKADIVIPVVAFSYPPQRGMIQNIDGSLKMLTPQYMNSRSQDLEKIYHDCGQFYYFSVPKFKTNKNIMKGKIMPIVISEIEMQDIDNELDWKLAELKYSLFIEKNKQRK